MVLFYIFTILVAYFVAAINPSIILSTKVFGKDIREQGSKNAGTTNAIRTMGTRYGILVFVMDILKVVISYFFVVLIGKIFEINMLDDNSLKTVFLLFAVIGHVYPIYYNFKGGKGVAVFLAGAFVVDSSATAVCLLVGVAVIAITRWVSLGSILGSSLLVIISIFMDTGFNTIILALAVGIILYKHKENIKRILNNSENKLFSKR